MRRAWLISGVALFVLFSARLRGKRWLALVAPPIHFFPSHARLEYSPMAMREVQRQRCRPSSQMAMYSVVLYAKGTVCTYLGTLLFVGGLFCLLVFGVVFFGLLGVVGFF